MKRAYLEAVGLIERLHRHFLDVVKSELDRMGVRDVNNVQALILYNVGAEEVTVGELTLRGYYLGSNVSYNLKKLIEHDYVSQARSPHDRRSVRVRLTPKGLDLHRRLDAAFQQQAAELERAVMPNERLASAGEALRQLERYWNGALAKASAQIISSAA
jgi:DNA-binding MarR family transcriptional regulator